MRGAPVAVKRDVRGRCPTETKTRHAAGGAARRRIANGPGEDFARAVRIHCRFGRAGGAEVAQLVPRPAAAAAAVRDPIRPGALGKREWVAQGEDGQPESVVPQSRLDSPAEGQLHYRAAGAFSQHCLPGLAAPCVKPAAAVAHSESRCSCAWLTVMRIGLCPDKLGIFRHCPRNGATTTLRQICISLAHPPTCAGVLCR
jgi:hypothetical protein